MSIMFKGTVRTICPFYLRESTYSISCEGGIRGTDLMNKFPSVPQKRDWQDLYCFTYEYDACPVAQMCRKLYQAKQADSPVKPHGKKR